MWQKRKGFGKHLKNHRYSFDPLLWFLFLFCCIWGKNLHFFCCCCWFLGKIYFVIQHFQLTTRPSRETNTEKIELCVWDGKKHSKVQNRVSKSKRTKTTMKKNMKKWSGWCYSKERYSTNVDNVYSHLK